VTRRFLLCAEDVLSATLARDLCDRVVCERARADWLRALWSPELRDTQRTWTGLRPDAWWADRGGVDTEASARGIRTNLRVRETGRLLAPKGCASESFRAVRVAAALSPQPDLVVIAGDTDGETDPAHGYEAGVTLADASLPVLVAEIVRESEAWVVAGFVPRNAAESARLRTVKRTLGFDPTEEPERLMSDLVGDRRDAKRVARALLFDGLPMRPSDDRVRACWLDTPLDLLAARGARAGLGPYLARIEAVLLPLLGDSAHL
jgi:hypothetical protein